MFFKSITRITSHSLRSPLESLPLGLLRWYTNPPCNSLILLTELQGCMYLSAPLVSALLAAFPYYTRHASYVGLGTIVVALIASSFATRVWHLILTQGVMYAIGGGEYALAPTSPPFATAQARATSYLLNFVLWRPIFFLRPSRLAHNDRNFADEIMLNLNLS